MSVIYVNTDNGNFQNKVYNGPLAKGDAAAVEKKMQEVVKVIAKNRASRRTKCPNRRGTRKGSQQIGRQEALQKDRVILPIRQNK